MLSMTESELELTNKTKEALQKILQVYAGVDQQRSTFETEIRALSQLADSHPIIWQEPDTTFPFVFGSSILNIFPLLMLQKMAEIKNSKFDISLLNLYYEGFKRIFSESVEKEKITNLEDVLACIRFLLDRPEVQAQINSLPVTNENNRYSLDFTQEKCSALILLLAHVDSKNGSDILNRFGSYIKITPLLVSDILLSLPIKMPIKDYLKRFCPQSNTQKLWSQILESILYNYEFLIRVEKSEKKAALTTQLRKAITQINEALESPIELKGDSWYVPKVPILQVIDSCSNIIIHVDMLRACYNQIQALFNNPTGSLYFI